MLESFHSPTAGVFRCVFIQSYPSLRWRLHVAACAATEPGAPLMPGSVNAPPPPIAAAGDALLTGAVWSWQETVMNDGKRIVPAASGRYTLLFQPGGMIAVQADCNRGSGSYLLNGGSLSFGPIAMTRAMCPPGSLDTEFLKVSGSYPASSFVATISYLR